MKTYYIDVRTLSSPYPLVLPLEKALVRVPRQEHEYLKEIGRFRNRRALRRAVKRLQAIA